MQLGLFPKVDKIIKTVADMAAGELLMIEGTVYLKTEEEDRDGDAILIVISDARGRTGMSDSYAQGDECVPVKIVTPAVFGYMTEDDF